ncbi:MAG: DNA recombination protein RmuC [Lysobacter sp.]|nr:DNA recombination protein RmuC [Lysobacter sp.]
MSQMLILLAVPLTGLLVYLALARLLRLRQASPSDASLLREERDRLATEVAALRADDVRQAAELARLEERAAAVARLEAELRAADERARSADVRARAGEQTQIEREEAMRQLQARLAGADEVQAGLRAKLSQLEREQVEATTHLAHSERANAEMRAFLEDARARLSATFAELAGKTFDERAQRAAQQSKGDLEALLKPFAERLDGFRQRVDTLYGEEAKERAALAGAVNELKTLNQDMATQAAALTRALKGNAKVRGDWGELMLENVLRGSGLEEGAHYERQQSSVDDDGRRLRPDVVVRLPGERRIVVDSKVNLVAWEEAMNADTPEAQQEALRRHAVALRQHVRDLADRNYPRAVGASALDVTVAFVPIEGALSAALGFDAALQGEAFERGVVFASPNTLMAVLRVVDRIWTREKIQKQALEISRAGGLLLDALIGFLDDFKEVGSSLEDATEAFRSARNRLEQSSQAVLPRARRLVELGAKGKRALPDDLVPDDAGDVAAMVGGELPPA